MKRFSLLGFLAIMTVSHSAQAEDQDAPRRSAQRIPPRHGSPQRQIATARLIQGRTGVHLQDQNVYRARQYQGAPRINSDISLRSRVYSPYMGVNANRGVDRTARNWNRNQTWQNNNGANASRDGRGRDGNWNRFANRRHWDRSFHDRGWWRNHYSRFALFGGGYYYWDTGYWYPAYGYDPYFNYDYDAPIYSYNDSDPGQTIVEVQTALNRRGYDAGVVDGTYGPSTRRALLDFQRESGLPETGEIDQETLESLGLQ